MMGRLENKTALVTGAAGGQGAETVRRFAREGCAVLATDLDAAGLESLAREVRAAGGRIEWIVQDVASEMGWSEAVNHALRSFGTLQILVNNAGTITRQGIGATQLPAWHRTIDVNLTGPMLGIRHAAPVMKSSGGGSVINVSSTAGLTAHPDAAYCASKWGLRGLTKMAAVEYADWGIRVNSIHPGQVVDTRIYDGLTAAAAESGRLAIPMRRGACPQECSDLILFLASDESTYLTGSEIAIDGGYSAGAPMFLRGQMRDLLAHAPPDAP